MPPPGRVATAAYAAGSFGTGVFSTVPAILLLYFCTETLHMAAAWAALVVFVPKVWAIAWDPLVGVWSDRSATRIGRRRPFLIVGACGVAAAFVAVFSPPVLDTTATFAWMATSYFLLATVYSVFAVPYVAIPSEIPAIFLFVTVSCSTAAGGWARASRNRFIARGVERAKASGGKASNLVRTSFAASSRICSRDGWVDA